MYKAIILVALMTVVLTMGVSTARAMTINIKDKAYIQGNPGFDPTPADVKVGEDIVWHNGDSVPHTATSGEPDSADPGSVFNTHSISPGSDSAPIKLSHGGEVKYFCQIHPFIVGKLEVK